MSKWTNATLTADGQNLQAQLLDGGGFEFTKVTAADSSGTDKLTLTMQPSVIAGQTITVPVLLSNSNLSAGFTMNQLKFYARKTGIPAGDEIVYAIAEDETGDEIPSESDSPGFTIDWSYTFQFGNATSVNVSIDPAGLVSMALLGTPGGIATLNNAGAVPIEQGGTGAVTASAALAALGGMRASATGDDIPTSASDSTSISSQLSNLKIKTYTSFIQLGLSGEIAPDQLFNALPTGSILITSCGIPNTLSERPTESQYGYIFCYKMSDATASFEWGEPPSGSGGYGNLYRAQYRTLSSPSFTGWRKLATATPPQEFDLPLVDGCTPQYTHSCIYYKTQETIVGVNVALIGEIPANSDVIIGTLPVGFRPKVTCRGVAGSHFSPYGVGSVSIDKNGNINVCFTAAQVRCNFTICFLAAD